MIYPKFLRKGDLIGVTACSSGCSEVADQNKLDNSIKEVEQRGFHVICTENVRHNEKGRSGSGANRAKELHELLSDHAVKAVVISGGGDYLPEMLPFVDYELIKKNPKWIQGYSDPTGLMFGITTKLDIATIYSENFTSFGAKHMHPSRERNISLWQGDISEQESFDLYEPDWPEKVTGLEDMNCIESVKWYGARGEKKLEFEGRLLGGCMDCILDMMGTPYEDVKGFIERYKDDGIVWFLESFALDSERLTIGLWRMKVAGWFEHCKGIVFGRPTFFGSGTDTTYEEAVINALGELNIPIICGADIGHRKPSMTVISGAYGSFSLNEGKGKLRMELK